MVRAPRHRKRIGYRHSEISLRVIPTNFMFSEVHRVRIGTVTTVRDDAHWAAYNARQ